MIRRIAMIFSRRSLPIILACSGLSVLTSTASIAAEHDVAIDQAIEALRQAMLAKDKAQLDMLCADNLTYGHSSGKVDNKMEFIESATNPNWHWNTLDFVQTHTKLSGDIGIGRAVLSGAYEAAGKVIAIKDSVLMVWQRQDGRWKLIERQAYKI
jgi:ketosteroid isomerase-like protein